MKKWLAIVLAAWTTGANGQDVNEVTTSSDSTAVARSIDLNEVTVKGNRLLVKTQGGTLKYNADALREQFSPTTAYDLLTKVPTVSEEGDNLRLEGARKLMIIIDGKAVMDAEHVLSQLKALSAEQVRSVEIDYNAPAKYHFNGAVINIRTTLGLADEVSMFMDASAWKTKKWSTREKLRLILSNRRLTSVTSGGYTRLNMWSADKYRLFPDGTFTNPYRINNRQLRSYGDQYRVGEDLTWAFGKNNRLTWDYYGYFNHETVGIQSFTVNTSVPDERTIMSRFSRSSLHTTGLQLDLDGGWTAGLRYKRYDSPYNQRYASGGENDVLVLPENFLQESKQGIDNVDMSLDKRFSFGSGASFSLGFQHQYERSKTRVASATGVSTHVQRENIDAMSAQMNFSLANHLWCMAGIRGEYVKSVLKDVELGEQNTLWKEFVVFPQMTVNWSFNKSSLLQFSLTSEKQYPTYWWLVPETTVIDDRSVAVGNEVLKSCRVYDAQLMLVLRQRWYFIVACTYTPDYFAKIPHQDAVSGKTVYKPENYDYSLFNSFTLVRQLNKGNYNSRTSFSILRMEDKKDDFYGSSFDNEKWVVAFSSHNSCRLPLGKRVGDVFLECDFRYQSPAIQGIYKLSETYSLDAAVRWKPNARLMVAFNVQNILKRTAPNEYKVTIVGQEQILNGYNARVAMLTVSANFGKKRDRVEERKIDMSRFGR